MNSIEAAARLEARQQELMDLMGQKTSVTQELEALQNERFAAVRKLAAGGNNGERETIINLEQQAAPLKLHLEGLTGGLIPEAEALVAEAKTALEEAQAQEAAEVAEAFEAHETADGKALIAGLPARIERIAALYGALCDEIGGFALDRIRVEDLYRRGLGQGPDGIEAMSMNFVPAVEELLKDAGYQRLSGPGYFGTLPAWGVVKPGPDYLAENPGEYYVDNLKFYAWQQADARADFARQFKKQ